MSDQTLYEIVDDFEGILKLLDDITSPDGVPCSECNPDRQDKLTYQLYRSTTDEFHCEECDDVGFVRWDDEIAMAAIQEHMEEIELDLSAKGENCARLIANWDGQIDMLKAEEDRLRARRKVFENRKQRLRDYLARHMERAGIKKIETNFRNIGWRNGAEVVVIDDEDMIPDGLVDTQIVIKPRKAEIKKLLKEDNQAVPGAHIHRNASFVVIK